MKWIFLSKKKKKDSQFWAKIFFSTKFIVFIFLRKNFDRAKQTQPFFSTKFLNLAKNYSACDVKVPLCYWNELKKILLKLS